MINSLQSRVLPVASILIIAGLFFFLVLQKQYNSKVNYGNWVEGWREVTGFQTPRRAPAAVIAGSFIYILGGVDENDHYVRTVEYSPIKSTGNLGEWKTTSDLKEGRFYLAAASDGQFIYALGGGGGPIGDDNFPLASVERAVIHPDGSLGKWQHHSYLTTPRRGLRVEKFNNQLYAIGGYNGQFLRSIERLDLNSTPQWVLEKNEAQIDRYIHATAHIKNQLYLLGGHVEKAGKMSYGDVETTKINPNGSLEPWSTSPSRLLNARFIATAFALKNFLYIVGGHNGVHRLDTVEMTSTTRNGDAGIWRMLKTMNYKRSAATSAVINNRVYVLGGMDDQGVLNTVETAILGPNGKLGHLVQQ